MKNLYTNVILLLILGLSALHAQVINSGKSIQVGIKGVPADEVNQISGLYPVSSSGYIRMPYIGNVKASGLTVNQLGAKIENLYRSNGIYSAPIINIFSDKETSEITEETLTLGGQVGRRGPIPHKAGLTLYEAVMTAGGPTTFGAMNRVELYRKGKKTIYNLNNDEERRVIVYADDVIEVPNKNWLGK